MDKAYFEQKFSGIETKLKEHDTRFDYIDKRLREHDSRFDKQDVRMDRIEKIMEFGFSNMVTLQNKMYGDLSTQIDVLARATAQGFKNVNERLEKLELVHTD